MHFRLFFINATILSGDNKVKSNDEIIYTNVFTHNTTVFVFIVRTQCIITFDAEIKRSHYVN